jgi:hypothetical protein
MINGNVGVVFNSGGSNGHKNNSNNKNNNNQLKPKSSTFQKRYS